MPRSTAVVPVVLDNRVQHLGKLYIHNIRAAQRLPLGTSDHVYSNHYTSVCHSPNSSPFFFSLQICAELTCTCLLSRASSRRTS